MTHVRWINILRGLTCQVKRAALEWVGTDESTRTRIDQFTRIVSSYFPFGIFHQLSLSELLSNGIRGRRHASSEKR